MAAPLHAAPRLAYWSSWPPVARPHTGLGGPGHVFPRAGFYLLDPLGGPPGPADQVRSGSGRLGRHRGGAGASRMARRNHRRRARARTGGGAPGGRGGRARGRACGGARGRARAWATPPGRTGFVAGGRAAARGGMSGLFVATVADRPRAAWSSRSGEWRRRKGPGAGLPPRYHPGALLAAALWAALLCYPASLLPGVALACWCWPSWRPWWRLPPGPPPRWHWCAGRPLAEVIFDGQVNSPLGRAGRQRGRQRLHPLLRGGRWPAAWSVQASRGRFADLSVGSRSGSGPRPGRGSCSGWSRPGRVHAASFVAEDVAVVPDAGPGAAGAVTPAARALVTPDEAARILGGPVRETWLSPPAGSGVIYRGDGGTVSVTVAEGLPGRVSAAPARRSHALAGRDR